jgi:hypothetical protein
LATDDADKNPDTTTADEKKHEVTEEQPPPTSPATMSQQPLSTVEESDSPQSFSTTSEEEVNDASPVKDVSPIKHISITTTSQKIIPPEQNWRYRGDANNKPRNDDHKFKHPASAYLGYTRPKNHHRNLSYNNYYNNNYNSNNNKNGYHNQYNRLKMHHYNNIRKSNNDSGDYGSYHHYGGDKAQQTVVKHSWRSSRPVSVKKKCAYIRSYDLRAVLKLSNASRPLKSHFRVIFVDFELWQEFLATKQLKNLTQRIPFLQSFKIVFNSIPRSEMENSMTI